MKFSKVSGKKAREFRHIYIYSIVNVTSAAFIAPIPKVFVIKVAVLQLESVRYQQTQSIGIHDVHLFTTELAIHYRRIFNYLAVFGCLVRVERICSRVLVFISRNKRKTGPEGQFFSV